MAHLTPRRVAWLAGAAAFTATAALGLGQDPAPTQPPGDYRIVYSGESTSDLYISDLANPPVQLTRGSATRDQSPDWSADGASIVFMRMNKKGTDADLWTIAPDGSQLKRITKGRAFDRNPAWSPDGTQIAFSRRIGRQLSDIWVVNADGTRPRRLTRTPYTGEVTPAWSPNGKLIVYGRQAGSRPNVDLWIMRVNGKAQKKLFGTAGYDGEPDFTPDGRYIVFSRESGRIPRNPAPLWKPLRYNLDVWRITAKGKSPRRITRRRGDDYGARVSPDGTRYVYNVALNCPGRKCNTELFIGTFGSTATTRLTTRGGLDWGGDWGPPAVVPEPTPEPTPDPVPPVQ